MIRSETRYARDWAMISEIDNTVKNICVWDGDLEKWQPPKGIYLIPAPNFVALGDFYDRKNDKFYKVGEIINKNISDLELNTKPE